MSNDPQVARGSSAVGIDLVWYAVALAAYVVVGYFFKPVLVHWTLGPLFLLVALYVVPALGRAGWARLRDERST